MLFVQKQRILALIVLAALSSACPKPENKPAGGLLSFDETSDAAVIVDSVNVEYLKPIKQRFKDNEPRLAELQASLKGKDPEKVRTISDQLVVEIEAGIRSGEEAIARLRTARDMNINADYKEYLELKIESLEKYIEAFEERRKAAIALRDGYDPKNPKKRDEVIGAFRQYEENFKVIMEDARRVSEDANKLAKDSLNRKPS